MRSEPGHYDGAAIVPPSRAGSLGYSMKTNAIAFVLQFRTSIEHKYFAL